MEWIGLLLTFITGGGIVALFTIKPQKQKVVAEAKQIEASAEGTELDNAGKAAAMWRETAEAFEKRYNDLYDKLTTEMTAMQQSITEMKGTISKLTATNNQILKILKDINHDNLEQKKQEAKDIAGA